MATDDPEPAERIVIVLTADRGEPGAPPTWAVTSPDVPGLATQGRTLASALEMAADAIRALGANRGAGKREG